MLVKPNISNIKKIKAENWILIAVIALFVLFKIQDLYQPCFWDEAWAYFPTIHKMTETSPTLFPTDAINPELYRGHPLLLYFMVAVWMKLFGKTLIIAKTFILITSVLYLLSLFVFAIRFFNTNTAILTACFLPIQSVFFVQSTLLLPEILLALFSLWTIYFYLSQRKLLTVLFLTLALYTKETAIVLWSTLYAFEWYSTFKSENHSFIKNLLKSWYLIIPMLISAVFYIVQYFKIGWAFFPEHIAFINSESFFDKFFNYVAYIFIYHGRNLITFSTLIALGYLFFKKNFVKVNEYPPVKLIWVFSFLY